MLGLAEFVHAVLGQASFGSRTLTARGCCSDLGVNGLLPANSSSDSPAASGNNESVQKPVFEPLSRGVGELTIVGSGRAVHDGLLPILAIGAS